MYSCLRTLRRSLLHTSAFKNHNLASAVLMVKPVDFTYNPETARDNEFMKKKAEGEHKEVMREYEASVKALELHGIQVLQFDKSKFPEYDQVKMPDGVFPNNWFSTTEEDVWLYRMKNTSRTMEKMAICEVLPLLTSRGYHYDRVKSWHTSVIQGTGVLLFDRKNKKCYINKSQRADNFLEAYCQTVGYQPMIFEAKASSGSPFYHTNVMLSIGQEYAVVASYSIDSHKRASVVESLKKDREVIEITPEQTQKHFCGNILQLQGKDGPVIAMSQKAYEGFTHKQMALLQKKNKLAVFPLNVIESVGGGSARCMLAEIFLKKK